MNKSVSSYIKLHSLVLNVISKCSELQSTAEPSAERLVFECSPGRPERLRGFKRRPTEGRSLRRKHPRGRCLKGWGHMMIITPAHGCWLQRHPALPVLWGFRQSLLVRWSGKNRRQGEAEEPESLIHGAQGASGRRLPWRRRFAEKWCLPLSRY